MTDDNDNDSKAGGRAPLTLKPRVGASVSSGVVKQSFSHGRSKTVVVETKRRRMDGPPAVNLAGPSTAERPAAPPPQQQPQAPRPVQSQQPGGLSREEQERRQRVAADFARQQAADQAAAQARRADEAAQAAAQARAQQAPPPAPAPTPAPAPAPVQQAQPAPTPAPAPQPAAPPPPVAAAPAAPSTEASRSFEQRREDVRRDDRTSTTTYRPPARPGGGGGAGGGNDRPRPEFRNERAPREGGNFGNGPRPPREGGFGDRTAAPQARAGETVRYSANAPRPAPGARPGPGGPRPGGPRGAAPAAPATPEVQRAARTAPPGAGKDRRTGDFDSVRRREAEGPGKAVSREKGAPQRREGRLTIQTVAGDEDSAERMRSLASVRRAREREREKRKGGGSDGDGSKRDVIIPDTITVAELSQRMTTRAVEVIKLMMRQGMMLKAQDVLDADTAELIATEFGHTVTRVSESDVETGFIDAEDHDDHQQPRSPVVAVMGHVDHGKTSLLDALRQADVASGERGGITQHIGAYQVHTADGQVTTFLDTPGHAAFSAMRQRGAEAVDIVVLVVAADDGVKPQTIEAIKYAREAGTPIIVAINKIDKPDATPQKVINDLLQQEIVVESLGGETQAVPVSAKTKEGLDNLLEAISLQAEVMELKANPDRTAEGVVIEAKLDKGRGAVSTVLVKRGTLKRGDIVVAGSNWGRVRALINERDEQLTSAGPSEPVEILGLDGTPSPGDQFAVVENEARARELTEYRQRQKREKSTVTPMAAGSTLADMMAKLADKKVSELPLVIKGDVQGSVEAIVQALEGMSTDEVRARIIGSGAGAITESDVQLAKGVGAPIIGFNVRASAKARDLAEREGVEIRYYAIIYDLIDDIKGVLSGMLAPLQRETFLGNAEVLQVFEISKVGKIAGCRVTEGTVRRGARVRIVREGIVVLELGTLATLKRFKDEVESVTGGQECGMHFQGFQDIREKDLIECFTVEEVKRSLA
jgi:translation initiation factor IF-2